MVYSGRVWLDGVYLGRCGLTGVSLMATCLPGMRPRKAEIPFWSSRALPAQHESLFRARPFHRVRFEVWWQPTCPSTLCGTHHGPRRSWPHPNIRGLGPAPIRQRSVAASAVATTPLPQPAVDDRRHRLHVSGAAAQVDAQSVARAERALLAVASDDAFVAVARSPLLARPRLVKEGRRRNNL